MMTAVDQRRLRSAQKIKQRNGKKQVLWGEVWRVRDFGKNKKKNQKNYDVSECGVVHGRE